METTLTRAANGCRRKRMLLHLCLYCAETCDGRPVLERYVEECGLSNRTSVKKKESIKSPVTHSLHERGLEGLLSAPLLTVAARHLKSTWD